MGINRCIECGSWEMQCSSDKPYDGCGCARCLSATNERLREEIRLWKNRYEELENNRADCCLELEKDRDVLLKALNEAAPDWIGDSVTEIQECLRDCNTEFGIRLYRAKNLISNLPVDAEAEARFEKLLANKRSINKLRGLK